MKRNSKWTPERIRQLRGIYDLTQSELARILGICSTQPCRWEAGKHAPDPRNEAALDRLVRGTEGQNNE